MSLRPAPLALIEQRLAGTNQQLALKPPDRTLAPWPGEVPERRARRRCREARPDAGEVQRGRPEPAAARKCAFDPAQILNPAKVFPQPHRCAELGLLHVHRGHIRFPDLPRF
jgi:hypothetical protein